MKLTKRDMAAIAVAIAFITALVVFEFVDMTFTGDGVTDGLIKNCILHTVATAFTVTLCLLAGQKKLFGMRVSDGHALAWCLPCLLVAAVNFPISALVRGSAEITRTSLIALFTLNCALIALFEEFLFRGLFLSYVYKSLRGESYARLRTTIVTSACFGLWHLTNLFAGAGVGATLLQVGYSFLIGAMLSAVVFRTDSVWLCVLLHGLFDFGGFIVPQLGTGAFQDAVFWALTAVVGTACAVHCTLYLIRADRRDGKISDKTSPDVKIDA